MKKTLVIALSALAFGLGAFGVKALADSYSHHTASCCVQNGACCSEGASCCK